MDVNDLFVTRMPFTISYVFILSNNAFFHFLAKPPNTSVSRHAAWTSYGHAMIVNPMFRLPSQRVDDVPVTALDITFQAYLEDGYGLDIIQIGTLIRVSVSDKVLEKQTFLAALHYIPGRVFVRVQDVGSLAVKLHRDAARYRITNAVVRAELQRK